MLDDLKMNQEVKINYFIWFLALWSINFGNCDSSVQWIHVYCYAAKDEMLDELKMNQEVKINYFIWFLALWSINFGNCNSSVQ